MKIAFITGGNTFWNREREIISILNKKADVFLIIMHQPSGNYTIEEISNFCRQNIIRYHVEDISHTRARNPMRFFKDYKLIRNIKSFKPDVIYIESCGSPYFAVLNRIMLGNKKTIIAIMDYMLHQREQESFNFNEQFYRFISTKFYKNFQFFSFTQEKLFQSDFSKKKSFVIRLFLVGTDLPRPDLSKEERMVNFLFFGRIFYYKGVDILIRAGNLLAKKYSNFKIIIAGDSESWSDEYAQLIENKSIFETDIRFIPKKCLPAYFQKADFFVAPYREVTESGPLLRAYYYNLIPIASDEDGFIEYIQDGKTGFIFKNKSAENLAEVMEKAIKFCFVIK
ncbi:MAG: glycosyltransferase [Bacteroidia bacterium]|nr:glycosyltransferase [Bacteroidia bacterium]